MKRSFGSEVDLEGLEGGGMGWRIEGDELERLPGSHDGCDSALQHVRASCFLRRRLPSPPCRGAQLRPRSARPVRGRNLLARLTDSPCEQGAQRGPAAGPGRYWSLGPEALE
jgi:hypothetical protein